MRASPIILPPFLEQRLSKGEPLGTRELQPGGYTAFQPARLTKVVSGTRQIRDFRLGAEAQEALYHCDRQLKLRSAIPGSETPLPGYDSLREAYDFAFSSLPRRNISVSFLTEVHQRILGNGKESVAGRIRTTQNWINGTDPHDARFVPPPAHSLHEALEDLDHFVACSDALPATLQAIIAFGQLLLIHPFSDGNGRMGRILLLLMLHSRGVACSPRLGLEQYFRTHRQRYLMETRSLTYVIGWDRMVQFITEALSTTFSNTIN
jgi:Fic family protein